MNQNKFNMKMIIIGLMSALCFIFTYFSISIPLPFGKTLIHFGNIFMLISALTFGPIVGGLSSAIGMSLFDLFSGTFVFYAPGTFIIKFLSGYVCGKTLEKYTNNNMTNGKYLFSGLVGILLNILLSPVNAFIVKGALNNFEILPLITSVFGDFFVSFLNGIIAVLVSVPISLMLRKAIPKNIIKK